MLAVVAMAPALAVPVAAVLVLAVVVLVVAVALVQVAAVVRVVMVLVLVALVAALALAVVLPVGRAVLAPVVAAVWVGSRWVRVAAIPRLRFSRRWMIVRTVLIFILHHQPVRCIAAVREVRRLRVIFVIRTRHCLACMQMVEQMLPAAQLSPLARNVARLA